MFVSGFFPIGQCSTGSRYHALGLFHLAKTMVSVLHKKRAINGNLEYKKLEVIQPRNKNKCEIAVGEKTIPDQSTRRFAVVID